MLWILLIVAATCTLNAQPAFEVASIKPNRSESDSYSSHAKWTGSRYEATNVKVKELIQDAFGVRDFQIAGAPGWTETEGFDIAARTAGSSTPNAAESAQIIRSLLVERFHLRFHRETRSLPAYSLIIAKGGPKLTAHSADVTRDTSIRHVSGNLVLNATGASMSRLAEVVSRRVNRVVLDETGLSGEYDIRLDWAPDPTVESADASIFIALQKQLGLKLDSTRAPVEIVVVDGVETPSEN